MLPAARDALPDGLHLRVRLDAADLGMRKAGLLQRGNDAVIEAGTLDAAAAVNDQRFMEAVFDKQRTDLIDIALSEINMGRGIKFKIVHKSVSLYISKPYPL